MKRVAKLLSPYLLRPAHLLVLARDVLRIREKTLESKAHLELTMKWLLESWLATGERGSSAGYSLVYRWMPAYPETSGYIIPTLWDYYHLSKDERFRACAISLADWEIDIQLANGAVRGGYYDKDPSGVFQVQDLPVVFNTGMVLHGWVRAFRETNKPRYREAAQRAAAWLVQVQEPEGFWIKGKSESTSAEYYSYYTMVAWALAEAGFALQDDSLHAAARKNLDWVVAQQQPNGFINHMSFEEHEPPLLHGIGYTLQGLLESGILLHEQKYIDVVIRPAEILMRKYELTNKLAARYNEGWKPAQRYRCVTGDAQMSIIWTTLSHATGDLRFFNTALKINDELKAQQIQRSASAGIRGGVRGSYPVWQLYAPLKFPNWAAKFFADALQKELRLFDELNNSIVATPYKP